MTKRNEGKRFEDNVKKSITDDMYYLRLKDSPSSFSQDSSSTRFTLNNPFDALIFTDNCLFPLELKSTQSTSISIQKDKTERSKMIKINQIEGLTESSLYKGIYAGFLFDFRKTDNTYYLTIKDFNCFLQEGNKKSINEQDVINYNGIQLEKRKLKINYRYDLEKLFKKITEKKDEHSL